MANAVSFDQFLTSGLTSEAKSIVEEMKYDMFG